MGRTKAPGQQPPAELPIDGQHQDELSKTILPSQQLNQHLMKQDTHSVKP